MGSHRQPLTTAFGFGHNFNKRVFAEGTCCFDVEVFLKMAAVSCVMLVSGAHFQDNPRQSKRLLKIFLAVI